VSGELVRFRPAADANIEERRRGFASFTRHLLPGRWDGLRAPSPSLQGIRSHRMGEGWGEGVGVFHPGNGSGASITAQAERFQPAAP
jgi:hypothetical protein